LTDSFKNDTVILHTPAEAVLKELLSHPLMTGRPDWSNWLSWATLASWVAIVLLAAVQYHHNRKQQALIFAAGLEASSRLTKSYAYSLKTTLAPTNPPSPIEWLAEVASIRRFDYFLTATVVLLVVVVCALMWAVVRAYARQSFRVYKYDYGRSDGATVLSYIARPNESVHGNYAEAADADVCNLFRYFWDSDV
jgi:hypothetical protein